MYNRKLILAAYNGNFDEFIANYSCDEKSGLLNICLCRGINCSIEFAAKLYESDIILCIDVMKAICGKFIMNDIVNIGFVTKCPPFCIWYPEIPNKETCIKLIKFAKDTMKYQVAAVSMLMNWIDIYFMCDVKPDFYLFRMQND